MLPLPTFSSQQADHGIAKIPTARYFHGSVNLRHRCRWVAFGRCWCAHDAALSESDGFIQANKHKRPVSGAEDRSPGTGYWAVRCSQDCAADEPRPDIAVSQRRRSREIAGQRRDRACAPPSDQRRSDHEESLRRSAPKGSKDFAWPARAARFSDCCSCGKGEPDQGFLPCRHEAGCDCAHSSCVTVRCERGPEYRAQDETIGLDLNYLCSSLSNQPYIVAFGEAHRGETSRVAVS